MTGAGQRRCGFAVWLRGSSSLLDPPLDFRTILGRGCRPGRRRLGRAIEPFPDRNIPGAAPMGAQ